MVFGFDFVLGFLVFVPQVLEAVGRKDLWTAAPVLGRPAGADSGLGSAANGFRPTAVRSPPQLHEAPHKLLPASTPQRFPSQLTVWSCSDFARHAHTQEFLPAAVRGPSCRWTFRDFASATVKRCSRLRPENASPKSDWPPAMLSDFRQPHLLHQTVLQRFEQPLDPPFRLRTVGRDPLDAQFIQCSPELRAQRIFPQLFCQRRGPELRKMLALSV